MQLKMHGYDMSLYDLTHQRTGSIVAAACRNGVLFYFILVLHLFSFLSPNDHTYPSETIW